MNPMKYVLLFGLLMVFLANVVSAVPASSSCGGNVLTVGQGTLNGEYTVNVAGVYSGNLVALQILKNGQHLTFISVNSGQASSYTDGSNVITMRVCSASSTESTRWADVTVTVSTSGSATPAPGPTPSPTPAPSPTPSTGPTTPSPSPSPSPSTTPSSTVPSSSTCGGSVLTSGQGVTQGEYNVRVAGVYSGNLVALQILKNGQHLTFISVNSGQTGSYTDGSNVITMRVCSASSTESTRWADVTVTVSTSGSATPAPGPTPSTGTNQSSTSTTPAAQTCSAPSLTGSGYSINGYVVKLIRFLGSDGDSGRNPVLQILKNNVHITFVAVNTGSTQTISNEGDTVQINVCEANAVSNSVRGTVTVNLAASASAITPTAPESSGTTETGPLPPDRRLYTISMQRGWNLFSSPSASSIRLEDVSTTCAFYPSNIFSYINGRYEGIGKLGPGIGYWFRATAPCTVTIKTQTDQHYRLTLKHGWNTIGVPVPVSASRLRESCNVVRGPYEYDASARAWRAASSLEPTRGYFVKVNGTCVIAN